MLFWLFVLLGLIIRGWCVGGDRHLQMALDLAGSY